MAKKVELDQEAATWLKIMVKPIQDLGFSLHGMHTVIHQKAQGGWLFFLFDDSESH